MTHIGSIVFALLGVIGNLGFGVACIPPALRVIRAGANDQLPVSFAWTLWVACFSFYAYLIGEYGWSWFVGPLGIIETVCYSIVLLYSYFPRDSNRQ